jgi:hypothetical protein
MKFSTDDLHWKLSSDFNFISYLFTIIPTLHGTQTEVYYFFQTYCTIERLVYNTNTVVIKIYSIYLNCFSIWWTLNEIQWKTIYMLSVLWIALQWQIFIYIYACVRACAHTHIHIHNISGCKGNEVCKIGKSTYIKYVYSIEIHLCTLLHFFRNSEKGLCILKRN